MYSLEQNWQLSPWGVHAFYGQSNPSTHSFFARVAKRPWFVFFQPNSWPQTCLAILIILWSVSWVLIKPGNALELRFEQGCCKLTTKRGTLKKFQSLMASPLNWLTMQDWCWGFLPCFILKESKLIHPFWGFLTILRDSGPLLLMPYLTRTKVCPFFPYVNCFRRFHPNSYQDWSNIWAKRKRSSR